MLSDMSGRDPSKYGLKFDTDAYGYYNQQMHAASFGLASSANVASPSVAYGHMNHATSSGVGNFTATAAAIDTDVDPKELDQYLPQSRRLTNPSYKTEDMVELQAMSSTNADHSLPANSNASKYDLSAANGVDLAGSSSGHYYSDNVSFYPAWNGNYAN